MTARAGAAAWRLAPERGSPGLIRFMAQLSLLLGRRPSRLILHAVVLYFSIFGGAARRASDDYLSRVLGREPGWRDWHRHLLTFSTTVHDRIYFLRDRFDLFEIEMKGEGVIGPQGTVLLGAHFGSFEALRASGRGIAHRRVAMAMYEENARKVGAVLAAISPAATHDIVALGRPEAMLELRNRLEDGAVVGLLADRTLGDEPTIEVEFLGAPARFPTGPMRMAAVLRRPVVFMAGIHRGGNRYEVIFEPLADFSSLASDDPATRTDRVAEGVRAYARRLEHHVRAAPWNWFNFFDFWDQR